MRKRIVMFLLFLVPALVLSAQEVKAEESAALTAGKAATLGLEASTGFVWDIENESTGLQTKVGMDLIFPLFPAADRGVKPQNPGEPAVRIILRNASFTWWNTYETSGGNYEQDDFNSWQARPLVLSFDTFAADLVWKNYFFRIASSTTVMRTDQISLFSIFDDVMDAGDRWYVKRSATKALWTDERYNIQQFPLLKNKIDRDYIDADYRSAISGILAIGAEFDFISFAVKAASYKNGEDNDGNAWLFGLDLELVPVKNLLFTFSGFAGVNYGVNTEANIAGQNPLNFGTSVEYRIPFTDRYILTPKIGFDFAMDTESEDKAREWELGGGLIFNTRGEDELASSRILDWDNVIPVGASFSLSVSGNNDEKSENNLHLMLSFFEPAGANSMLPWFGGFLQLEAANLLNSNGSSSAFALLTQLEYMIAGKITPYIRGGYMSEFQANSTSEMTGSYLIKGALGCYLTLVHFFSMDIRYELNAKLLKNGGSEVEKGALSAVFTIRM